METLALVGPTATGKTAVGIALARLLGAEIVSADAVAVYKRLDIGSAKPTQSERALTPFHLLDAVDPEEDFTVADFERLAGEAFSEIRGRGKLPLVVGGTGLYVRAVTATLSIPAVAPQPEFRAARWAEVESFGSEALHARLASVDPASAAAILPGDAKRIIRALEVLEVSGKPASAFRTPEGVRGVPKPETEIFGLTMERAALYRRIEARIDAMLERGFEDEVRGLLESGVPPEAKSLKSLGYRHLVQFLRSEISRSDAVALLKQDTRRFAKRQLSWFRGDPAVRWIEIEEDEPAEAVARRIASEIACGRRTEREESEDIR